MVSQAMAAMSFSRNHSRHDRFRPGCGEMRGRQSGLAARNASSPPRTTTTSPGSTLTPARLAAGVLQLLGRHRMAHGDVAFLASGGDVQQHAAREDTLVEDRINGAPGGAVNGQAVGERTSVVQFSIPAHVAQCVDVGDPEAVVDHVEAVQHHVRPLAFRRKGDVVHVHGRGTTSRASDTARPLRMRSFAAACLAGVTRFSVPSWSSLPQRPQLFSSLK